MKRIKQLLVALALMTVVWRLDASTVVSLNFEELSRASATVVAGEVLSVTADRDAAGYIHSNVTIRVAEAVPAALAGTDYTFRMIGGELDGESLYIQGMPQLAEGDDVILFLNESPDGVLGPTVGLWQGVFRVDAEAGVTDNRQQLVVGVDGARLTRALPTSTTGEGAAASDGSGRRGMDVSSFFDAVRQARAK